MSVELWKSIFDWATVVLIAFTVVSGAGALITGDIISRRQEAKLRQFDIDLTGAKAELEKQQMDTANAKAAQQGVETELSKQRERAAKAETELLALQMQHLPRSLRFKSQQDIDNTIDLLRHSPSGAEILYKEDDAEAYWLADEIFAVLRSAGWPVLNPAPVPHELAANIVEQLGASTLGVSVTARAIPDNPKRDDPFSVLSDALSRWLGQVSGGRNPNLPDNFLRIVVMARP